MFIAILTYKKPLEEVDRFLQAHREYLASITPLAISLPPDHKYLVWAV